MVEGSADHSEVVLWTPPLHPSTASRSPSPSLHDREETDRHDAVLTIRESIVGFSEPISSRINDMTCC